MLKSNKKNLTFFYITIKKFQLSINFQWEHVECKWRKITLIQCSATLLFFWAWRHQFIAHKIFAQLKKELRLSGSKSAHSVPYGDWFYYVSCPHYLAEILMYASLAIILGYKHQTAIVLFLWVLINQLIAGLMSHFWYLEKYSQSYPKNRKAVIPFVL